VYVGETDGVIPKSKYPLWLFLFPAKRFALIFQYDDITGRTRGQASLETLTSYVRSGMSPLQIIQAATINAATLLGLQKEIGSLEPSKTADIVAVPGKPLLDPLLLQRIGFVMKAGEIVRNEMQFADHP
jgi:adenine deaminase